MKNISKLLSVLLLPLALTGCLTVDVQESIDYKGNVAINGTVDFAEIQAIQTELENLKDPADRESVQINQEDASDFCDGIRNDSSLEILNPVFTCFKKSNSAVGFMITGQADSAYFRAENGKFFAKLSQSSDEKLQELADQNLSAADIDEIMEGFAKVSPKISQKITLPKPILSTPIGTIDGNSVIITPEDTLAEMRKILEGNPSNGEIVAGDLPVKKLATPKKVKVIQTNNNKNRRTTLRYSNQQARPVYLPARTSFTPVRIEKKEIPMIKLVPATKVEVEVIEQTEILLPTEVELIEEILEEIDLTELIESTPVNSGFVISDLQISSSKKRGE